MNSIKSIYFNTGYKIKDTFHYILFRIWYKFNK